MNDQTMSLTAQQIFDKVVNHLRQQGKQSYNYAMDFCAYRGLGETKCAIGCLIPDSEYTSDIEGKSIDKLIYQSNCPPSLKYVASYLNLLADLQGAHDCYKPDEWEIQFRKIAECHHLTYTSPENNHGS